MSQSSEQIEAKLCAYLEGELDEQGRAEIEKHLQANPAHRKLLAEVAGTRDLLRALPREQAPADLCETLQGHLERSVLLGDAADEHAGTRMRIGRWRPILAIAAMVILAVGLGLVIYFGLPSAANRASHAYVVNSPAGGGTPGGFSSPGTMPAEKPPELEGSRLAISNTTGEAGGGGGGAAAARRGMSIDKDAAASGPSTASTTSPTGGNSFAWAETLKNGQVPETPESLQSLAQRVPKLWSLEQQRALFYARGRDGGVAPTSPAIYFVLSTPQPAVACAQVTRELEKLEVAWEAVPPTTVLALHDESQMQRRTGTDLGAAVVPGQSGLAKKLNGGELKQSATANATSEGTLGATPSAAPAPAAPSATAPAAPQPTAVADASRVAQRPEPTARLKSTVPAPSAVAGAAAANSAPAPAPPSPAKSRSASTDAFAEGRGVELSTTAVDAAAPTTPAMILARNVTRRQAESLRATLSAGRADQQVVVWSPPAAGSSEPARQETAPLPAASVAEEAGVASEPPSSQPTMGRLNEAGVRAQVALRSAQQENELRQRPYGERGAAPGGMAGAGGEPGAAGKPAGPARVGAERSSLARRRVSEPSTGAAANTESVAGGVEAGGEAPDPLAQAKEDVAEQTPARPAPSRDTTVARAPVQKAAPSGITRAGRKLESSDAVSTGPAPAAPAGEADKESLALRSTEAPVADAPATTVPAESVARDEERVDLVILVKSADTATVDLGTEAQPSGPAATAPIEKFEILTVTLGDDDATNVRVGEDGMIDLPPAGKIAAEGLTSEALGKRISESLGRTSVDAKGKVTVSRPGAGGAATRPDGKPDGQSQTPTGTDSPQPPPPAAKEPAREEPSPAPTQD